jgi:2-polyprenyl-3-methyl-5-hydroxy-6-metoxy-1,4-benzoquinol methylase
MMSDREIRPLRAERFMKAAIGHMSPYKGTYIYDCFLRDFREKTDQAGAGYGRWLEGLIRYLIATYDLRKEAAILDFGCGMGELSVRMASLGYRVTGLDRDPDYLALARILAEENGLRGVDFVEAKELRLPFADGSFDIITMFSVVEHLSDAMLDKVLPELARVSRGVVFVVIPNKLKARDDHTGLPFLGWMPRWAATVFVRLAGRSHPSSMSADGRWDVYYRTLGRLEALFKRHGFGLNFVPRRVVYPDLAAVPPIRGIGKTLAFGGREVFAGIPFPVRAMLGLGVPREAFYPYLNLVFVPQKTLKAEEERLGKMAGQGERIDPQSEADVRAVVEHAWRYRYAGRHISGKALDIGCGTGYGTRYLYNLGIDVRGIDVSPNVVSYASRHYAGPEYAQSSAERLPFPDGTFDSITAFEVIEHVPDPQKAISEIRRVLKKGGRLFTSTPNPRNLRSVLKHILYGRPYPQKVCEDNPYHVKEFHYDEFIDFLKQNGFTVKAVHGQTVPCVPTSYRPHIDIGALLPRFAFTILAYAVKEGD